MTEKTPISDEQDEKNLKNQPDQASAEINRLRQENKNLKIQLTRSLEESQSIQGIEILALRLNPDKSIEYVNTAFLNYFDIHNSEILGKDYSELYSLGDPLLFEWVKFPVKQGVQIVKMKINNGDIFKIKLTRLDDFTDIVYENVTDQDKYKEYVNKYVGSEITRLSDSDLSTFSIPERRILTISHTKFIDFLNTSDRHRPDKVREIVNSYLEVLISALEENNATVDQILAHEVIGLHGAPKYYKDHALRAVLTAGQQMEKIMEIRSNFFNLGIKAGGCGVGIDTGQVIIGNIGSSARKHYTAMGKSVNISDELAGMASEGEILITENTLNSILGSLPADFEISWPGVDPLDTNAEKMISIGSDENNSISFKFIRAIKVKGIKYHIPVFKAFTKNQKFTEKYLQEEDRASDGVRLFGKYQLIKKLGKGGMGEVWLGEDQFGNAVAIKTSKAGNRASSLELEQFKKEAEIMSRLSHRGICKIFEVGQAENINYISMEYIEGITLYKILKYREEGEKSANLIELKKIMKNIRNYESTGEVHPDQKNRHQLKNYLSPGQAVELTVKICSAIKYAHSHNVYHRDIKPQNIIINEEEEPVIMDFGIAKVDASRTLEDLSKKGQIYGTIEYMAPEQAEANVLDNQKADIYGIGAVLYQMLIGKKHFNSSKNLVEDLKSLRGHEAAPLRLFNKNITPDLEFIVLKALKNNPAHRYNTVDELQNDLKLFQKGLPVNAVGSSITYKIKRTLSRHLFESFLIAFILLILASAVIWLSRDVQKNTGNWILTQQIDFINPDKINEQIDYKNSLNNSSVTPFELVPQGIIMQPYNWLWLKNAPKESSAGNIKIKINLTYLSEPNTFRLLVNSTKKAVKSWDDSPVGTLLEVGGYFGTIDVLARKKPGAQIPFQNTLKNNLEIGNTVEIILEKIGDTYYYQKNGIGHLILEDPAGSHHLNPSNIGIQTFAEKVVVHSLSIYRRTLPIQASSLILADGFITAGNPGEAFTTLMNIAVDYKNSRTGAAALLKAYKVASENPGELGQYKTMVKQKLVKNYPSSDKLTELYELELLEKYRAKKFTDFNEKLESVFNRNPRSEILSQIDPNEAPAEVALKILDYLKTSRNFSSVRIPPGSNLTPGDFKNFPLSRINIEGTRTQSLDFTGTMPLTWINISQNNIMDLEALKGKFIRYLSANHNKISSLKALSGMKLEYVLLAHNDISQISELQNAPLKILDLADNNLTEMPSLNITRLISLNLARNKILEMPELNSSTLKYLNLENNRITRINFLKGSPLVNLNLNSNNISDISPLTGLPVESLELARNPVQSLDPLKNIQLKNLNLSGVQLRDFSPLNSMTLQRLNITGSSAGSSLNLSTPGLEELSADNCGLDQVAGLSTLQLKRLSCSANKISSLEPVQNMPLKYLNVENNPITSFGSFAEAPPDTFLFFNRVLTDEYILGVMEKWNQRPHSEFNLHYARSMLGLRNNDIPYLKKLSSPYKGHHYLHIPIHVTLVQAGQYAAALGGHLVTFADKHENDFVYSILKDNGTQWIGTIQKEGAWAWSTGEPMTYQNTHYVNESSPEGTLVYGGIYNGGSWTKPPSLLKTGFIVEWDE